MSDVELGRGVVFTPVFSGVDVVAKWIHGRRGRGSWGKLSYSYRRRWRAEAMKSLEFAVWKTRAREIAERGCYS